MVPLGRLIPEHSLWEDAAPLFQTRRISAGVNEVLSHFHGPAVFVAGGIFLVSLIILSIPAPRKRRPVPPARPKFQVRVQRGSTQTPPVSPTPAPTPMPTPAGNNLADASNTEPSSDSSSATAETLAGEKGA
jgi:hypothetical protein